MAHPDDAKNREHDESGADPAITEDSARKVLPAPASRLAHGTEIAGKYAIRGVLGTGGWAVVYEAEHVELGSRVAIKVLHRDETTPESVVKRFRREARLSAAVRHPNVLEVYDVGSLEDGSPYLVMERLEGENLSERIHRSVLEIAEVIDLAEQLAGALSALEVGEIVHRDIKPHNIMLHRGSCGETVVKLVDFGISKSRNTPIPSRGVTEHGVLIGTPHYMSPEQIRNEPLDVRSDIYSAGVVLFEALTGCTPFDAPVASALIAAILRDPLPDLRALRPDCPDGLERIVRRALARNADERYASSSELALDLARLGTTDKARSGTFPALDLLSSGRRSQPFARAPGARLATRTAHDAPTRSGETRPLPAPRKVARSRAERLRFGAAALVFLALLTGSLIGVSQRGDGVKSQESRGAPPTEEPARSTDTGHEGAPSEEGETPRLREGSPAASEEHAPRSATPARRAITKTTPMPKAREPDPPPADAKALSERALGAYVRGQFPMARQLYRRALDSDPAHRDAWRGLGLVASRMGRTAEAKRAFRQYLALAPAATDATEIRARLHALADAP